MFNFRKIQIMQEEILPEQDRLKGKKGKQRQDSGRNSQDEKNPVERKDRKRDDVAEYVVESKLLNIQLRQTEEFPTGFPIYEVIKNISAEKQDNNFQGGFAAFWKILRATENGDLLKPETEDFRGFRSAIAETIVYYINKNAVSIGQAPILTTVLHDPVKIDPATGKAGLISFLLNDTSASEINEVSRKITDSVGKFTPDILVISPPYTLPTREGTNTFSAKIPNVVDPRDPTASHTIEQSHNRKTLISPMEVTTSNNLKTMQAKVKKFESYKNPFKGSGIIDFVPILVLDKDAFLGIDPSKRAKLVDRMTRIGGVIQVITGLNYQAEKILYDYAPEIIREVAAYRKQHPRTKEIDSKQNTEKRSLSSRLLAKSKEWFQKLLPKSSSNNQIVEVKKPRPIQKESVAETYQKMVSEIKSNSSSFQKVGLDTVNSSHVDLIIAASTVGKNLDTAEILKQSPTYLSQDSAVAKMWLNKIVEDGEKLTSEGQLSTSKSQEIIQFYNDNKTKANVQVDPQTKQQENVSAFDQAVALVKKHSSTFEKLGLNVLDNRKDLLAGVSFAIISGGNDPSKLLRQSPEFLAAATPKEGEALISESIEKAKSTLESTKSEPAPEQQKSPKRGGFER
jgi:hypothetical protein